MQSTLDNWVISNFGIPSSKEWMISNALDLLNKASIIELPINPMKYLIFRKIKKIEYVGSLKEDGVLVNDKDGFRLKIREELRENVVNRFRFTIAHEIGHTFFFDISGDGPVRRKVFSADEYLVEEKLCDTFAANFLLPHSLLRNKFQEFVHGKVGEEYQKAVVFSFLSLQSLFEVSLRTLLIRMSDLLLLNGVVLYCRWVAKEGFSGSGEMHWRIVWNIKPQNVSQKLFIPGFEFGKKTFPKIKCDVIFEALSQNKENLIFEYDEPRKNLRIGSLLNVLEMIKGKQDTHKVYCLLTKRFRKPISNNIDGVVPSEVFEGNQEILLFIPFNC